jgi:hypothetical protein
MGEIMNIYEMAEQASKSNEYWLEHFAALVAAAARADEREECAKLAETTVCDIHLPTGTKIYGSRVAAAIRARGTT